MAQTERTALETQELILTTAEAHLRRYGYARTTISEIARARKMSHVNGYSGDFPDPNKEKYQLD